MFILQPNQRHTPNSCPFLFFPFDSLLSFLISIYSPCFLPLFLKEMKKCALESEGLCVSPTFSFILLFFTLILFFSFTLCRCLCFFFNTIEGNIFEISLPKVYLKKKAQEHEVEGSFSPQIVVDVDQVKSSPPLSRIRSLPRRHSLCPLVP